jgi:putative ABC transport system ATP-binding protein
MDTLIRTLRLGKEYPTEAQPVVALRDVTLDIGRGELVAVMGPSGSGKSTLLNLLGCMDRPSNGRYLLDGQAVSELGVNALARIRNRRIGLVFQNFNLLARTSAAENVELPLLYDSVSASERRKRVRQSLEQVGLIHRMGHFPSQLSGGEQQRVAIARALVNDPALILADEPTGALDSRTGREIIALFQTLNRTGITIVLVTHDRDVAAHAQRVIVFRDGSVVGDVANARPRDARNGSEDDRAADLAPGIEAGP